MPLLSSGRLRKSDAEFRQALLDSISTIDIPLFIGLADEPSDPRLLRYLEGASQGTWRVVDGSPAPVVTHRELRSGNWLLYVAPQPLSDHIPDTFRTAATEIIDFMRAHSVALFIDSFHDDTEWTIGLFG